MNKIKTFISEHKAISITAIIIAVIIIAGGITFGVHANKVAAEKAIAEKEAAEVLSANQEAYKTAKFQLSNRVLSDEDRSAALTELATYKDKINKETITEKEQKSFDSFVAQIAKDYAADKTIVEEAYKALATTYAKENGYYSEDFNASLTALTEEYQTLLEAGQYQEAYKRVTSMDQTYLAYIAAKDTEKSAAEAEKEASKSSGSSKKNSNSGSSSSGSSSAGKSTAAGSTSGSESAESAPSGTSDSFQNIINTCRKVEGPNGWVFYVDANNYFRGGENIPPEDFPAFMQWAQENGYGFQSMV